MWLQGFILNRSCTWYHLLNHLILIFQIIISCGSFLAEMENLQPQLPFADKIEDLWDSEAYSQAPLWDLNIPFGETCIDTDYSGSIIFSLTNIMFLGYGVLGMQYHWRSWIYSLYYVVPKSYHLYCFCILYMSCSPEGSVCDLAAVLQLTSWAGSHIGFMLNCVIIINVPFCS